MNPERPQSGRLSVHEAHQKRRVVPFYEDLPQALPLSELIPQLKRVKYRKDLQMGITKPEEIDYFHEVTPRLMRDAAAIIARENGEDEAAYALRVLSSLSDRVRYPAFFADAPDELYLITKNQPDQDVLLMALEAKQALLMEEENRRQQQLADERANLAAAKIRMSIIHDGQHLRFGDELEPAYENGTSTLTTAAKRDVVAFETIAEILLNEEMPSVKGKTYKDYFTEMESRKDTKLQQEKRHFHEAIIQALLLRKKPIETEQTTDPLVQDMIASIQGLEQAVAAGEKHSGRLAPFLGFVTPLTTEDKRLGKALFENYPLDVVLDMAAKGGDFLSRSSKAQELSQRVPYDVPKEIHLKRLVQAKQEEGPAGMSKILPAPSGAGEKQDRGQEEALQTQFVLGAVGLEDRRIQNVYELAEHSFAHDLAALPKPSYTDKKFIGPLVFGLRHPIRVIWQQGLARAIFEQQHLRFASDVVKIASSAIGEKSIPVEVTASLLDTALMQGREEQVSRRAIKRLFNKTSDFLKGITGFSQTSEQTYAKQWLKHALHDPTQAERQIQEFFGRVFSEHAMLGQRYAIRSRLPASIANRLVTSSSLGDSRFALPEYLREEVNTKIKTLIAQFATGQLSMQELACLSNAYFQRDLRQKLPENLKRSFSPSELGINILPIAQAIRENWNHYSAETPSGNSVWEEVTFDVFLGNSEWGGVRGKVQQGLFQEVLSRKIAKRQMTPPSTTFGGVVAFTKDGVATAGAYAAGWALLSGRSATVYGTRVLLGSVGGAVLLGGRLLLRETGLSVPGLRKIEVGKRRNRRRLFSTRGRYQKEIDQLSRNLARGRETTSQMHVKMQEALVSRLHAREFIARSDELLKGEMTASRGRALLAHLAHLDARLRLSDLSGTKRLKFQVQNYLTYTEGMENAEHLALRAALIAGIEKLAEYAENHPQVFRKPLFTRDGTQGLFIDMSGLLEAQLVSSSDDANVRKYLQKDLRLSPVQAERMMQELYRGNPHLFVNTKPHDAIAQKEKILRSLKRRRGVSYLAKYALATALTMPVVALGSEIYEEQKIARDIGWNRYSDNWSDVLRGRRVAQDISPLQRVYANSANFVEEQTDTLWDEAKEWYRFGRRETDERLEQLKDIVDQKENGYENAGMLQEIRPARTVTIDGQIITIPQGTELIRDGDTWDLVVSGDHDQVLINDMRIDSSGNLRYNESEGVRILENEQVTKITGAKALRQWERYSTDITSRTALTNGTFEADHQELELHNSIRQKTNGTYVVTLDASQMETVFLNGEAVSVQDAVIAPSKLLFAFSLKGHEDQPIIVEAPDGRLVLDPDSTKELVVVGNPNAHLTVGEFTRMIVDQNALLNIDPRDGPLETELNGYEHAFKLGNGGRIEAVFAEDTQEGEYCVLATIHGTGKVGWEEEKRIREVTLAQPITIEAAKPDKEAELGPTAKPEKDTYYGPRYLWHQPTTFAVPLPIAYHSERTEAPIGREAVVFPAAHQNNLYRRPIAQTPKEEEEESAL